MKKLLLIALIATGCNTDKTPTCSNEYNILIMDSCEYISSGHRLAHKGNCKRCRAELTKIMSVNYVDVSRYVPFPPRIDSEDVFYRTQKAIDSVSIWER